MAEAVHGSGASTHDEHGHDAASHALHEQHPYLQHHWDTPAQQFDAGKLGMWLFLATEVLFFAGLFCAYAVLRRNHPDIFLVGQHFLDVKMGALNTVVLIVSSFTMALGVWCAQTSRKTGLIVCLILTLIGAFTFMIVKYFEYSHKIHDGVIWGQNFNPQRHDGHGHAPGDSHAAPAASAPIVATAPAAASAPAVPATPPAPAATPAGSQPAELPKLEVSLIKLAPTGASGVAPDVLATTTDDHAHGHDVDPYEKAKTMRDLHLFMGVYFCLTGLHGIHVLAGIVAITCILIAAIKGKYDSNYYTPVDLVGLYWHVVDLVWIFLFPLLYLIH